MKIPFKYIKYLHLSRLAKYEHQRAWLVREHQADLRLAKDETARQRVIGDMQVDLDLHDEEVNVYQTNKLAAKARRLMLPMPVRYEDDGRESSFWEQGKYTGDWYLTNRGKAMLHSEIRREHKERNERWIPIFLALTGALTGIIGAVTGLISVMQGHGK